VSWSAYAITGGALPPGLAIDPLSGTITGIATDSGVFGFQVTASDVNGCAGVRGYNLIANPAGCPEILITPGTLPSAQERVPYSTFLVADGGAAPYTWGLFSGSLPVGLTLNAASGEISGTPVGGGDFSFQVLVEDANGCFAIQAVNLNLISDFALFGIFRDGFEGGP
jgi:hypothetical protein